MFFIRWTSWPFRSINSTTTNVCRIPNSRYHLVAATLLLLRSSSVFRSVSYFIPYLIRFHTYSLNAPVSWANINKNVFLDNRSDLVWYDLIQSLGLIYVFLDRRSDLVWYDLIRRSNFLTCIGLCLCWREGGRFDQVWHEWLLHSTLCTPVQSVCTAVQSLHSTLCTAAVC
jgi:uncharacterized membrane protein